MKRHKLRTSEHRIGIVGLARAGKTVFLTSLIDHLRHHDPGRFELGKDGEARIRKFRTRPVDDGWAAFPYEHFRDSLVHHAQWPEKTRDCSQFVCTFERSDWLLSDVKLKLYDFPGERIADAAMAGLDYAGWSDHVLDLFQADSDYRGIVSGFLAATGDENAGERQILDAYRLALARLILNYNHYVTPSTFLLDANGRRARPGTPEEIAAERVSGIDGDHETAPLSREQRERSPGLAATFADRYDAYKRDVVVELVEALRSCHSLIVLVDVVTLLAGGVSMYNGNLRIIEDLFEVLDPGEGPLGRIIKDSVSLVLPHTWRPGGIRKVAVAATKLDLVHPSDRGRVTMLLEQMCRRKVEDRDGLDAVFESCSAIASTQVLDGGDRELFGMLTHDTQGQTTPPGAVHRFSVAEPPEEWPLDWPPGQYCFPHVYPRVPKRQDCPPGQINVDRVLNFVLT